MGLDHGRVMGVINVVRSKIEARGKRDGGGVKTEVRIRLYTVVRERE